MNCVTSSLAGTHLLPHTRYNTVVHYYLSGEIYCATMKTQQTEDITYEQTLFNIMVMQKRAK